MGLKVKDIANLLHISPSTVSMVLNNKPGASEGTRQKILKVVSEMGYDTNILSKPALKNNKSIRFVIYKKHGKVISDTPFFSALMEGIEQEARDDGYNMVITYINEKENKNEVMRIIEDNPMEGILLLATEMVKEDLEPFQHLHVPVVILDSHFKMEKHDSIVIANKEGAYEATQYFIHNGHKEIGYLHSSVWINNFDERREGLSNALTDGGMKWNKKYVFELESTMDGAYRDMCRIIQSKTSFPTAFFADNDIIAMGAVKALKENDIRVPEDVSIIGFDDMPFCEMIDPPLTTVRVFKQRMGKIAVKRLLDRIRENMEEHVRIEVGTELIVRGSVCTRES